MEHLPSGLQESLWHLLVTHPQPGTPVKLSPVSTLLLTTPLTTQLEGTIMLHLVVLDPSNAHTDLPSLQAPQPTLTLALRANRVPILRTLLLTHLF